MKAIDDILLQGQQSDDENPAILPIQLTENYQPTSIDDFKIKRLGPVNTRTNKGDFSKIIDALDPQDDLDDSCFPAIIEEQKVG